MIIIVIALLMIYKVDMNRYFSQRQRIQGYSIFVCIATLCSIIISLRYAFFMPTPQTWYTWLYVLCAYIGQMSLLTLACSLLIFPCVFISIHFIRRLIISIAFSILASVLLIDTIVFALYRVHINKILMDLYFVGNAVEIPSNTLFTVYILYTIFACAIYVVLFYCERKAKQRSFRSSIFVLFACILCLCLANILHAWAVAFGYQPITLVTRYLPLYTPLEANSAIVQLGITDKESITRNTCPELNVHGTLHYPKKPIRTQHVENPPNIVWIVIDSLRFDTYNEIVTPNIYTFGKQGISFPNHHSTGNVTRAGIFGLFYGIPATYWNAFLENQTPPLLITRMQELNYDIQILSSASTTMPEFNRTVFSSIPHLSSGANGKNKMERDIDITQSWLTWFANRDTSQPFFTYLFYDAVHGGGIYPSDYPVSFGETLDNINYVMIGNSDNYEPIFNRYKTASHFVDSLIGEVIRTLEESGVLENTLIVITSDHGEEMNDNRKGYWGHNGNFTSAQTHVPLTIIPPRSMPLEKNLTPPSRTSHEDIAPTLLATYLGIENPTEDYSTGINLFHSTKEREFFVIASYAMYGIVSDKEIIEVNPYGSYEVLDIFNTPKPNITPNFVYIRESLSQLYSFYQ